MPTFTWPAAVWAALGVVVLSIPSAANAAPVRAGKGNIAAAQKAATANKNGANHAATVAALHQARTILQTALHDYDGHRARAVGHVTHAIHELSPHHKNGQNGKNGNGGNGVAKAQGETQAQSDQKLQQALQIIGSLNTNNAKAAQHLQNAVAELNTALKIK
jgi:hypothetical protein